MKRDLERKYGRGRRSDIEDVVYAEFMHMLQMYDSVRARHVKFPNFLKNYFVGWCHRHLAQVMATTKKGPVFLNSSNFDEDQSNYIDMMATLKSGADDGFPEVDVANKDVIKVGLEAVRVRHGERVIDALLLAHLYGYTHIEISEMLGCTQARVSQMLQDAKECFLKKIKEEDIGA